MNIKIINATILNLDEKTVLQNMAVCIENDIISFVGENDNLFVKAFQEDKLLDFQGDILSAGFINAHSHNAMTLFRGLKDDAPLQEWLFENMFVIEKHLTPNDVFFGTQLGLLESIKSGITTNLDAYFFPEEIVKANIAIGTRNVCCLGATMYENRYDNLQKEYEKMPKNDLISYVAYAHSIYTLEPNELEETVFFAKDNKLPMHIHLAETLTEVGECVQKHNKTPVQLLEDLGFLEHKCSVAHGVHIDKDDYFILQQHDVSVVHCPASNMKLGSGIAPIHSMKEQGINICLGTDGPASNNSLDMFREMYLASLLQKVNLYDTSAMPSDYLLKMATINGAKALNLENIGEIKVGFKADLIRIALDELNLIPLNDLFSLVYSARPENIKMTMVNGKILYDNGVFASHINVSDIVENAKNAIIRLKKQSNL